MLTRGNDDCLGLLLQGGNMEQGVLHLNDGATIALPTSLVRWTVRSSTSNTNSKGSISLPVFLDGERKRQLFTITVGMKEGLREERVLQSGCVFLASA